MAASPPALLDSSPLPPALPISISFTVRSSPVTRSFQHPASLPQLTLPHLTPTIMVFQQGLYQAEVGAVHVVLEIAEVDLSRLEVVGGEDHFPAGYQRLAPPTHGPHHATPQLDLRVHPTFTFVELGYLSQDFTFAFPPVRRGGDYLLGGRSCCLGDDNLLVR